MTRPGDERGAAPPVPVGPDFLLWREIDRVDRRIDENRTRIDGLDQHGSRGVDALRGKVDALARDIEAHEEQHEQARRDQVTGRRWLLGIVAALIVPLYPLLGYLLTHLPK